MVLRSATITFHKKLNSMNEYTTPTVITLHQSNGEQLRKLHRDGSTEDLFEIDRRS